jgi:UDP-GlcNAc:undecaprenyl-phosphate GlcNAc-1-phosphate transferase
MRLGHGHRRTVIILWSWTVLLCGFVLLPLFDTRANVFIPLGVAVLVIALFTWFSPLRGRLHRLRDRAAGQHERIRQ